jgi:hypothetical protein
VHREVTGLNPPAQRGTTARQRTIPPRPNPGAPLAPADDGDSEGHDHCQRCPETRLSSSVSRDSTRCHTTSPTCHPTLLPNLALSDQDAGCAGAAHRPSGRTTTLRAALAGRARSRPGRTATINRAGRAAAHLTISPRNHTRHLVTSLRVGGPPKFSVPHQSLGSSYAASPRSGAPDGVAARWRQRHL